MDQPIHPFLMFLGFLFFTFIVSFLVYFGIKDSRWFMEHWENLQGELNIPEKFRVVFSGLRCSTNVQGFLIKIRVLKVKNMDRTYISLPLKKALPFKILVSQKEKACYSLHKMQLGTMFLKTVSIEESPFSEALDAYSNDQQAAKELLLALKAPDDLIGICQTTLHHRHIGLKGNTLKILLDTNRPSTEEVNAALDALLTCAKDIEQA